MYCPKCGKKNDENAAFCIYCGQRISAPEPADIDSIFIGDYAGTERIAISKLSAALEESTGASGIPIDTEPSESTITPSIVEDEISVLEKATPSHRVLQGRYTILKELGAGGMGKVYLARDEKMDFDVVIKEMLPFLATPKERQYIQRHFIEEAKMLYRLKHMGLPRVMDFFVEGDSTYIVMEYIDGEDLETIASKRPDNRITIEEFIHWTDAVLKILKYLHNQKPPIIHRDIKPGNIMLTKDNQIVLVDFGVARTISMKSGTQTRVGTPGFASPEHFFGKFVLSSDIFSLGATMHYMLSGDDPRTRSPFDYPPLNQYRDDIPPALQRILDKMLEPEVEERYSRVEEVEEDLEKLSRQLAAQGIITRPLGGDTSFMPVMETQKVKTTAMSFASGPLQWHKIEDFMFEGSVCAVAFSSDGKYLACGTGGNIVQIIDAKTWEFLHLLTGHLDWVRTVVFSPDGRHLASGSDDKLIKIWEVSTGRELKTMAGHEDWVRSLAYSPDGTYIVSGSYDGKVKVWSTRSWGCVLDIDEIDDAVNCVAYSPLGRLIASGSDDSLAYTWNPRNGQRVKILRGHDSYVLSVAFSPDGRRLATGSGDKKIIIWDAQKGDKIATLTGHTDSVLSVAFSPDGSRLVSGSDDKTVRIWNLKTKKCETVLEGHNHSVYSVVFNPSGDLIVSGSGDKSIIVWGI